MITFMSVVRIMFHYFGSYVSLVIISTGIVGNLLSIVVFFNRRRQDRASAQYLGLLAVVDLTNLSLIALHFWFHMNLHIVSNGRFSYDKFTGSAWGCKFLMYGWNVVSFLSSWIIISFSIERCLVIWFPLRMAPIVSSSKPRKMALGSLVAFAGIVFLTDFPWMTMRAMVPGQPHHQSCSWRTDISTLEITIHLFLSLGASNAIPCVLVTILNGLLLVGIRYNRMDKEVATNASKTDMRCVRNLLLVSTFYFIFMAPFCMTWAIYFPAELSGFDGYSAEAARDFGEVALFTTSFTYLNYSINPLLYTLSLDFYRAECKRIICRIKTTKLTGNNTGVSSVQ